MFGQGGSLFNLSLGDLAKFLEKANADPTRKITKELKEVRGKLNNIDDLKDATLKQLKIDKELLDSTKKGLRERRDELLQQEKRAKLDQATKPRRSIRDVLDDMTGGFVDFRNLGAGTAIKTTGALVGSMIAPPLVAMSTMNDVIQEIGINNEQLLDTFIDINAETQDIADNSERFRGSSRGHLQTLISAEQIYGTMADVSLDTLDTIEAFPFTLGLTVEQGREFLNTMRGITAEGADFNASMIRSLGLLSESSNIPMGWMMNDISENAEFFAQRSGRGMENIAESVVHARRLGIQMGTIVNMLSGLDTVESVIESQMRLSLFTGRQINLLDSATANFMGDTEKATTSLLKEIENIDEATFNLPFVRKQMAEQLNVSATEMNNIYESVKRIGAESTAMDLGFTDDFESFREMTTGVGMSRVRKSLTENILNPVSNALSENTRLLDNMFKGTAKIIDFVGNSIIAPFMEKFPQLIPVATAIVGTMSAIGLGNTLQLRQVSLLEQIRNAVSFQAMKSGMAKGGSFLGRNASTIGKTALGLGVALPSAMAFAGEMGKEDSDDASMGTSIMSGISTGAGIGLIGGGKGALIGGAIGGLSGGLGHLAVHGGLAEGGIATTPMLSPIAETRPEAVIPLDSSKTKEMMTLNLTDTSIEKLARAISKEGTNITIDYRYNGKKMDDSEQFFDEIRR